MNRYERFLQTEFVAELESNPELAKLVCKINDHVRVFVFGGWCRDKIHSYMYNEDVPSRDIDLVVDGGLDKSIVNGLLHTQFGGFRIHLEEAGRLVDFWPLNKTFAFAKGLFIPNIQNLLKSTVFDVNSILFEINKAKLINGIAFKAIDSRQIGFNCREYLDDFADLQAYRAFAIARKLNYNLGGDVISFITNLLKERSFDQFVNNVQKYRTYVSRDFVHRLYRDFLGPTSRAKV